MTPVKPGFKTTEFLLTVLADVGFLAASIQGSLPPKWAAIAGTVSTGAYALSRAWTKAGASS